MSATSPAPAPTSSVPAALYRNRWLVMTVVIIADVMDLIDGSIAQLAGPTILKDIGGAESTLQWIVAAYTLAFAVG